LGLITEEVWVRISPNNIKHFEEKGYEIPRKEDKYGKLRWIDGTKILVKIEELTKSSDVKVDIECDGCGKELKNISWNNYLKCVKEDGKYYCNKCSNILSNEFSFKAKYKEIEDTINEKLGWKTTNIKKIKSIICVDLIDNEGYMYNDVRFNNIKINKLPRKWDKSNIYTIPNINLYCKLNNLKIRFVGEYIGSDKKSKWKCLECNNTFKRSLNSIKNGQISCLCCNDGISYPEKFGLSLFNQLNIDYIYNSKLSWSENKKYDFIYDDLKIIVEMHGKQHYEIGFEFCGGKNLKEEQSNDKIKKELAEKNGYKYIEIDCRKSNLDWIKNSIFNSELFTIFDLSNIDWLKCHEFACNSLVKVVSDLWNSGIRNTLDIANKLKLSRHTILDYLKQAVELKWCDYYGVKRKVVQLTYNYEFIKEFISISDAEKQTGISSANIVAHCQGKIKSTNKYIWVYKENYSLKK